MWKGTRPSHPLSAALPSPAAPRGWLHLPSHRRLLFPFWGVLRPSLCAQLLPDGAAASPRRSAAVPVGRCRAERSICRGFGSAGCGGSSRASRRAALSWDLAPLANAIWPWQARGAFPGSASPVPAALGTATGPPRRWGHCAGKGPGAKGGSSPPGTLRRGAFGSPQVHCGSSGVISCPHRSGQVLPASGDGEEVAGSPPWGSCTSQRGSSLCFQHLNLLGVGRTRATNGDYLRQNESLCLVGLPWKAALCL